MRLVCPNCDAAYEVPDSVIPIEGRDVQCSDCGQTWYQYHPENTPEVTEPAPEPEPEPPADPAPSETRIPRALADRAQRSVSPDVQDILREEAELEARARQAESLESQPDLGLPVTPSEPAEDRRTREARTRMARIQGQDPSEVVGHPGSRKEMLPDIEEINSTLRATTDRSNTDVDYAEEASAAPRRGFWGGFVTIMAVVAVLALIYAFAPQIARTLPWVDPLLSQYVAVADNLRNWLNENLASVSAWLETVAGTG